MTINVRVKGQTGEREIADDLNAIIAAVRKELLLPALEKPQVQRNQNQSAVGGCDLTGTYDLAIEIKRQEALSINTWWAQTVKSSSEVGGIPVLLFRQNAKPGQRTQWRCLTIVELPPAFGVPGARAQNVRAEISYDTFKEWFRDRAKRHTLAENPQVPEEDEIVALPVRAPRTPSLFDAHV